MFREILKKVVNNKIVGKLDIERVSSANKQLNNIINATMILNVIKTSSKRGEIGIMKKITAANKYSPINKSPRNDIFFTFHASNLTKIN